MFLRKKQDSEGAKEATTTNASQSSPLNELVLQSITEGVLIVGNDYNIHLINPAAAALIGRGTAEVLGLNFDSVVTLFDKTGKRIPEGRNPVSRALKLGQFSETRDLDIVSSDSRKTTPVSIITSPLTAQNTGIVVTIRDIEEELRQEHERSEFISTASHEMRTPVASIEGYLGLAMNPSTATIDERAASYLEKAHEASQHLGRLFQDLLDTTKLDDGMIKPEMRPVDVVGLTRSIADSHIPSIAQRGLGYQFGSPSTEAQLSGGRRIDQVVYANLDPSFLHEIVSNLIENSIKYTPSGWITVNVSADEYNVRIVVEDTGIGIARNEQSHVFQKFYRVDNRDTREIGGTGLGLYLVKQRVEAMSGKIWVESELGKGSKFIAMFPRVSSDAYHQYQISQGNALNSVI